MKFNIYERFLDLNDTSKKIILSELSRTFQLQERQVYNMMKSDNIAADRLLFIAKLFDVNPENLLNEPMAVRSLNELKNDEQYKRSF